MPTPAGAGPSVFISYSHRDEQWLEQLRVHLRPFFADDEIILWDDTAIRSGANWREEIDRAMKGAKVAVLLVSPDFLASEFIRKTELPALFEASDAGRLLILWVPVSDAAYAQTPIERLQAVHDPQHPLDKLSAPDRNTALKEIAQAIRNAVDDALAAPETPTTSTASQSVPEVPKVRGKRIEPRAAIHVGALLVLTFGFALAAYLLKRPRTMIAIPSIAGILLLGFLAARALTAPHFHVGRTLRSITRLVGASRWTTLAVILLASVEALLLYGTRDPFQGVLLVRPHPALLNKVSDGMIVARTGPSPGELAPLSPRPGAAAYNGGMFWIGSSADTAVPETLLQYWKTSTRPGELHPEWEKPPLSPFEAGVKIPVGHWVHVQIVWEDGTIAAEAGPVEFRKLPALPRCPRVLDLTLKR